MASAFLSAIAALSGLRSMRKTPASVFRRSGEFGLRSICSTSSRAARSQSRAWSARSSSLPRRGAGAVPVDDRIPARASMSARGGCGGMSCADAVAAATNTARIRVDARMTFNHGRRPAARAASIFASRSRASRLCGRVASTRATSRAASRHRAHRHGCGQAPDEPRAARDRGWRPPDRLDARRSGLPCRRYSPPSAWLSRAERGSMARMRSNDHCDSLR